MFLLPPRARFSSSARRKASGGGTGGDPYYNSSVLLLLHLNGANGSTTITDSSPAARTPSSVGGILSTAQAKFGTASLTTNNVSSTSLASWNTVYTVAGSSLGQTFTIECWLYRPSGGSAQDIMVLGDSNFGQTTLSYTAADKLIWNIYGSGPVITSTNAVPTNTWFHFAVTKDYLDTVTFWVNGVSEGTYAAPNGQLTGNSGTNLTLYGIQNHYIDEFRLTQTDQRYTASFTPPTEAFPDTGPSSAISLLMHMDGTDGSTSFPDNSLYSLVPINSGTVTIKTDQSKFGGASCYFPNTGTLTFRPSKLFEFPADFTLEFWVRQQADDSGLDTLLDFGRSSAGIFLRPGGGTAAINGVTLTGSFSLTLNTWHHIAVVRSGTSAVIYKDGASMCTGTVSGTVNVGTTGYRIMWGDDAQGPYGRFFQGWVDEIRITKGTAVYLGPFTPPSAAFPNP